MYLLDVARAGAEDGAHTGTSFLIEVGVPGGAFAPFEAWGDVDFVVGDHGGGAIGRQPMCEHEARAVAGEVLTQLTLHVIALRQEGGHVGVEHRVSNARGDEGEKRESLEMHLATT